jgi:formamidopyrimidine-DNA glycosylase
MALPSIVDAPMPELPEVEFAVRALRRRLARRTIASVRAHHPAQRRTFPPSAERAVKDQRVARVERRGKHQLIHLANGATLLAHFRMNGDWAFGHSATALPPHARVSIDLTDGTRVVLTDSRALCTITYHKPGSPPALDLGPEPEDRALTPERLQQLFAGKRGPIKVVLLDQTVLAGVGNIYAVEALWRAQLSPRRAAASLTLRECAQLLRGLRKAFADGHVNAARYHAGARTVPFKVYDREGKPCRRCGRAISRITQGQRSTYFCPSCQR